MKVLLIPPTYHYNHHYPSFVPFVLFPTGFAYIASSLRESGNEVYGLNLNNIVRYSSAYSMIEDKISKAVKGIKPDLIGIGGLCTDYSFIRDSIKIIRSVSNIPIVVGGGIITNDAEYIFNQLHPDFCIIGEGEESIVKLANMIVKGGNYEEIPNIGYWNNGVSKFTKQDFNYNDINRIPFPDYEPFDISEMMGDYALTSRWVYRYTRLNPNPWVIITARSCPFSCTFCVHQRGPKYRARSIESIIEEIKVSYEEYHYNILIMMDELFATNKVRTREFCTALIEAKKAYNWDFDWSFNTHASARLDEDTLKLAKKSGCFFFSYGLESASPRVLESMNKKIKPLEIATAIKLAEKTKLSFGCNLIFGDPAETEDTMRESIDFMVNNCLDTEINVNAIRPYPGSKLFDDCIKNGLITDKFDYYEHIDERPWDMTSNMTSIPNKRWIPLLDSIVAFGQLLPWVKSVVPYKYEIDLKSTDSPVVLHTGKQVYNIWAKCPHCGNDIHCRELLMLNKSVKNNIKTKFGISDIKLIRDAAIKAIRLITLYYFSFSNPIYKLLKKSIKNSGNLLWDSFFSTVFFGTGCTHCHKKVKIVIPIPFTMESLSIMEVKRRLNLLG